jgi:uncharacterized protein (TIGR02217 family)
MIVEQRLPASFEVNAERRETEPGLTVSRSSSGKVFTNNSHSQGTLFYDIKYPTQGYSEATIKAVKDLYRAVRGGTGSFLFRDFDPDFSVIEAGQIGVGDGAETAFQIIKSWTVGSTTSSRTVTRPDASTLTVYNNGSPVGGGNYSLDDTTGIITFNVAPGIGEVITVDVTFNIRCRFAGDYESVGITHWLEAMRPITLEEVKEQ